ncbi:DNA mismatch repair endonuclease MutL [Arsukibacterium indicum]|uniref:DNA mismatch repair protein MutL n=1 Tax=Arsukibacterium indicum TaxID=2848612 RepID=A0ABS6MPN5_9GAMM|nr:DNA mismatch repair endonuclease MutL [Arsukibacterium indicum]MBV2130741.1 DNA mismatch repair endonuclease MutL [Arsukibacterium indicum]
MTIKILPPQLANQIAAGEVVERPASVVKELIENSLDAGASQIDIDIEKGGSKLIRIRDNGSGIAEQELVLALSRHATSKISDLNDLEQITSLGFRGEALASISSVSRLTLTSKPPGQVAAWQAQAEGRDMAVTVKPAAHPEGTSIEVVDLFFNTPARRKFLRTDKTEFTHIDELIKRLALSRFDVSWQLNHNGQSVRRLPRATTEQARMKRVAMLCGRAFAEQAAYIENSYGALKLSGWLLSPQACQSQAGCQYSYVNGRMMRDKLLNHAIRQAYGERINAEQQPGFVLYLQIPATEVDVNVHPAKHEVRFHQARLVHDFVVSALSDALNQLTGEPASAPSQVADPPASYISTDTSAGNARPTRRHTWSDPQPGWPAPSAENSGRPEARQSRQQIQYLHGQYEAAGNQVGSATTTAAVFLPAGQGFAVAQGSDGLVLVDLAASLARQWLDDGQQVPLLLPLRLMVTPTEKQQLLAGAELLQQLGFDILLHDSTAIFRAVAPWLRSTPLSQWLLQALPLLQPAKPALSSQAILSMLLSSNWLSSAALLDYFANALSESKHWLAVPLDLSNSIQAIRQQGQL